MILPSALVVFFLIVAVQGRRTRTYGAGLAQCKKFRVGCSLTHLSTTPLFIVDDDIDQTKDCLDYLPKNPKDIMVGDPNQVINDHWKKGLAQVKMCVMEQKYKRILIRDQHLPLSKIQQLDFTKMNLNLVQFKGTCWACP